MKWTRLSSRSVAAAALGFSFTHWPTISDNIYFSIYYRPERWSLNPRARLAEDIVPFIRVGIVFFGALFVLLLPGLAGTVARAQRAAAGHRWWLWLIVHLATFAALYAAVAATFGQGLASDKISPVGLALCTGAGIATVATWLFVIAPISFWSVTIVRERLALALALVAATAAWLAGLLAQSYWQPLASGTMFLVTRLLHLFYPQVVDDTKLFTLGTSAFQVKISPYCSGFEGIGLITVFLALYLWLFRARIRFPHALLLFPIGIAAIWLANVVRIALLIGIGTSYSAELAAGSFHSEAGWMSFVALASGFVAVTHRMQFFASQTADKDGHEINPTAAALLVPFLLLTGLMMITSAFSLGFDRFYPLRMLAAIAALVWFRRIYAQWNWNWSWLSVGIGGVVFVMWMVLEPVETGKSAAMAREIAALGQGYAALWIGFRVIGSVIVVPLAEEMAFRGYLLRRLSAADWEGVEASRFRLLPFLLSSAAFGLLHGRWIAAIIAGMAYALAYYRRGRLGDAVAAHVTTNGLIALWVLATGTWSLWN